MRRSNRVGDIIAIIYACTFFFFLKTVLVNNLLFKYLTNILH